MQHSEASDTRALLQGTGTERDGLASLPSFTHQKPVHGAWTNDLVWVCLCSSTPNTHARVFWTHRAMSKH